MFAVEHYNFGTRREFETFADACAFAAKQAFEAAVYNPLGALVAIYSPITGWRF